MKYMYAHPMANGTLINALRKAFNLNPAYPISQLTMVVKSRGVKHANEILEENGFPYPCYHRNYCSDTGNVDEQYLCDSCESGIIIAYSTVPAHPMQDYKSWDEIKEYYYAN